MNASSTRPAVPPEMTETAYNVIMSGFPWGPHKKNVQGRQQCPCGKGHDETVHHTFKDCTRSRRLHEMTLKQWREVTGETKVKASEGRITLLGDRSCTWLDDAEQSEWAGLEEPFAILHKVTLHTIKLERDKDAAARKPTYVRRTAAQLYQKVASTVDRIVQARWASARAAVVITTAVVP